MSKAITYTVIVDEYGYTMWYFNDRLHRVDGPAVELSDGYKTWYLNGKPHRTDGPAIERTDGFKAWWLDGVEMTEEQHHQRTQPAIELTVADIEKMLGKKIKIVK